MQKADDLCYKRMKKKKHGNHHNHNGLLNCCSLPTSNSIYDENLNKKCHQCQEKNMGYVFRCENCTNEGYCYSCMLKWYPKWTMEMFTKSCPVCLDKCNCTPCLRRVSSSVGTSTEIVPSVAEGDSEQLDAPSEQLRGVEKEVHEDNVSTVQAKIPASRLIVSHENEGVDPSAASVVERAQMKEVNSPTISGTKSLEKDKKPLKELHNESQEQDLKAIYSRKKYSSGRGKSGKQRTISTETLVQDSQDASKEKANENMETRKADASAGKLLDIVSDVQPLSRCIDGMHSPIPIHSPASVKQLEAVTCDTNAESLPFVKCSPIWPTIEAMEAFQKIPQNPHFRLLLEGVKESAREGLAIGTMVTFSTMVDSINRLRFEDPRSTIEDCLETLVELESNGFNVEVIRDRLTCLLQLKVKQEELEDGTKGVVEKIEKQKIQEKTVGDEVDEIDRQIRQLEETRRKVLLNKEEWKLEVDAMKATEGAMEQKIIQLSAEFDGLAAAPL